MNNYAFGGRPHGLPRPLAHHPHQAASGIASLGRGNDSMLVHMTPNEVSGLQHLAMRHGGSLTINPHTGLPEAGFLSKLLPALLGGALDIFTGGAISPLVGGMIAGVGTGATTGNWKEGLMTGLSFGGGMSIANAAGNIGAATTALDTAPVTPVTTLPATPPIAPAGASNNIFSQSYADAAKTGVVPSTTPVATTVAAPATTVAAPAAPTGSIVGGTDVVPAPAPAPAVPVGSQPSVLYRANAPTSSLNSFNDVNIPKNLQSYGSGVSNSALINSGEIPAGVPNPGANASWANVKAGAGQLYDQPGYSGIKGLYYNLGQGAGLGNSGLANMGVAAATAAPMFYQPSENIPEAGSDMSFYVPAPGYNSLYNRGRINPNIARLGYLPAGQESFIGQGFNPGVYSKTPPTGMRAGGLMGIKHMATGGTSTDTPPAPASSVANLNNYYANALSQPQPSVGQYVPLERLATPEESANQANYLAGLQQMVTPPSVTGGTATYEPSTSPVPGPTGSTTGSAMSYIDPTTGKTVNLPQYSYNPKTGFKLESGSANSYTDPKTGKSLVLPQYSYDPQTGGYTVTNADKVAAAQAADIGFHQSNNLMTEFGHAPIRFFNDFFGLAHGGGIHGGLGTYADTYAAGGKLLRGDGDGMSDSIPAVITGAKPQRAALADGEFVIPADVVSHLGNGSTEAGSKTLYKMMDKVRRARTGNPKQGKQINPNKYLPV